MFLIRKEKENERKLLASEVIAEFFKPLLNAEEVVKAIKGMKIENEIVVRGKFETGIYEGSLFWVKPLGEVEQDINNGACVLTT